MAAVERQELSVEVGAAVAEDAPVEALAAGGWLADDARIYLELPARTPLPGVPGTWRPLKSGRAGDVGYHLLARAAVSRADRGAIQA